MFTDLRLSWCSDCQEETAFEFVSGGETSAYREWACTVCGAAYLDQVRIEFEPARSDRGAA